MTPFLPAAIPEWGVDRAIATSFKLWKSGNAGLRKMFPGPTSKDALAQIGKAVREQVDRDKVFINDKYQVNVRSMENMTHLSIKRLDKQPIHDWRELQEIKNQLVGPEHEGVELYPAESRLVDSANQFHIWVVKDKSYRFPFGFQGGRFVVSESIGDAVQRPR